MHQVDYGLLAYPDSERGCQSWLPSRPGVPIAPVPYECHRIPAGEKWHDGSLRPSWEDFVGAGAVISYLGGKLSPEAPLASAADQSLRQFLERLIRQGGSGRELIERGSEQDVAVASERHVSACVLTLVNGAFANHARSQVDEADR